MESLNNSHGKKYIKWVVISLLFLLTLICFYYYKYDPYGYLKLLHVKRLSKHSALLQQYGIAPLKGGNRIDKLLNVSIVKPRSAVFGSSCVFSIIDITHSGFKLKENQPSYNFGYAGANIFELKDTIKHTMAINKLDLMVIGLEFYMFSADKEDAPEFADIPKAYNNLYQLNLYRYVMPKLLSIAPVEKVVTEQIDSLFTSIREILPNPNANPDTNTTASPTLSRDDYLAFLTDFEKIVINALYPYKWQAFHFKNKERDSFAAFREIVEVARENNTNLIVYITPNNARTYEYIHMMGLWPQYQAWLSELTQTIETNNKTHSNNQQYTLWDFSGYNSITMDPIKEHPAKTDAFVHYYDSIHWLTKTATLALNRMFDIDTKAVPDDFGVKLTSNMLNDHFAKIDRVRKKYVKQNLQENQQQAKLIEELRPQHS